MSIRKYLFWITKDGIQTYKVSQRGIFELVKFKGEKTYNEGDFAKFVTWFQKNAAITEDEYIDFCYLSDEETLSPLFSYPSSKKSSWDRHEIGLFCNQYINVDNYEVIYDTDKSFVCQTGNIFDKSKVKELYIKCVPEFSIDTPNIIETGSEETSLINRFFMDRLKELSEK